VSVPRRRWPDDPARPGRVNAGNFVSGVRFRRSLQEANPQSIWLKAAFVSGLSYQVVLSLLSRRQPVDQRCAKPPTPRQTPCLSHAKRSLSSWTSRPIATSISLAGAAALARPRSVSSCSSDSRTRSSDPERERECDSRRKASTAAHADAPELFKQPTRRPRATPPPRRLSSPAISRKTSLFANGASA
jgi:hypothetical protein